MVFREQIRRILRLPNIINFEYKRHQDSLVDKSSYRNPTMSWRAPAKNLNDKEAPPAGRGYNNYNKGGDNRGNYQQGQPAGEGGYKNSWGGKPRWQENNDGQQRGPNTRDDNRQQSEWRNPKHNKPEEFNSRTPKVDQQTQGGSNSVTNSQPPVAAASTASAGPPNSTIRAPTGEVWTKVKNPFNKDEN